LRVRWPGVAFVGCRLVMSCERTVRCGINTNYALRGMKGVLDSTRSSSPIKQMRKLNSNMTISFCRQMRCHSTNHLLHHISNGHELKQRRNPNSVLCTVCAMVVLSNWRSKAFLFVHSDCLRHYLANVV
jgi:hypothetical protein